MSYHSKNHYINNSKRGLLKSTKVYVIDAPIIFLRTSPSRSFVCVCVSSIMIDTERRRGSLVHQAIVWWHDGLLYTYIHTIVGREKSASPRTPSCFYHHQSQKSVNTTTTTNRQRLFITQRKTKKQVHKQHDTDGGTSLA